MPEDLRWMPAKLNLKLSDKHTLGWKITTPIWASYGQVKNPQVSFRFEHKAMKMQNNAYYWPDSILNYSLKPITTVYWASWSEV